MKIRVAGIAKESVVDGPGIRAVVFAQGCPRQCPGCHNPDALDPTGGEEIDTAQVVREVAGNPIIRGVSFSGGDPFMQAVGFVELAVQLRERGLNILTFTGYTWEDLQLLAASDQAIAELIKLSDWLIDGPFIEEEKDLSLAFRGSKNQRIIDVKKTLDQGCVIEAEF